MNWIRSIARWFAELVGRGPDREFEPAPSADEYVWRPAAAPEPTDAGVGRMPRFTDGGGRAPASDMLSAIRARLRFAFTPAQPVTDRKMFAGRGRVMGQVIQAIEDQRLHTVIYGERGLGKTSTLHVLAQIAREAKYTVVYVTCSASSTFDEVFRAFAAGIPLIFHADFGPTSPQAERRESLATLLGPEPVGPRLASELLAKVVGTRVLVILDEFDRSESQEFRLNIAELIKSLSDRAAPVQLMIGGVAANLSELIANVPSIQRNIFALQLPKMTAEEISDLVRNGEGVSGVTFDSSALETIWMKSLGFPYLATLLSQRSALVAIDRGRVVVEADDVVAATGEVVEEFRGRVSRRSMAQIEECAAKGMLPALGALGGAAQSVGGWFQASDVGALHAEPALTPAVNLALDKLIERKLLLETRQEEIGRAYHFIEESVPPYLWLAAGRGASHADHEASVQDASA